MKISLAYRVCSACGIISAESCIPKFTEKLAKEGKSEEREIEHQILKQILNPLREINL